MYKDVKIGNKSINILDTPGFGDTRGIKTDTENINKIKEAVSNLS